MTAFVGILNRFDWKTHFVFCSSLEYFPTVDFCKTFAFTIQPALWFDVDVLLLRFSLIAFFFLS